MRQLGTTKAPEIITAIQKKKKNKPNKKLEWVTGWTQGQIKGTTGSFLSKATLRVHRIKKEVHEQTERGHGSTTSCERSLCNR